MSGLNIDLLYGNVIPDCVDHNRVDSQGNTAIMNAAAEQDWELVLSLLDAGANVNIKAFDGSTLKSIMRENDYFIPHDEFVDIMERIELASQKEVLWSRKVSMLRLLTGEKSGSTTIFDASCGGDVDGASLMSCP